MKTTTDHFNTFFEQATNVLPKSLLSLHQDLEKNLRVALDAALRKMNLVTREEFEVQSAVLERTRARLEALEVKVAALEAAAIQPNSPLQPNQGE
ncbi:MAG TPA: accessory factor UbiK family protein [Thiotrichaceae bacterium]|nr:accessory factor UbiK family protein [Thiotrichaceae bacterium]